MEGGNEPFMQYNLFFPPVTAIIGALSINFTALPQDNVGYPDYPGTEWLKFIVTFIALVEINEFQYLLVRCYGPLNTS